MTPFHIFLLVVAGMFALPVLAYFVGKFGTVGVLNALRWGKKPKQTKEETNEK